MVSEPQVLSTVGIKTTFEEPYDAPREMLKLIAEIRRNLESNVKILGEARIRTVPSPDPLQSVVPITSPKPTKTHGSPDFIRSIYNSAESTKTSTTKHHRTYFCDEVYERMNNGLCWYCEEPDLPDHYLKHKGLQVLVVECEDDHISDDNEFVALAVETSLSNQKIESLGVEDLIATDMFQDESNLEKDLNLVQVLHQIEATPYAHKSTSINSHHIAHQLFDTMHLRVQKESSKEADLQLLNKSLCICKNNKVMGCSSEANHTWKPGGVLVQHDDRKWLEKFHKLHRVLKIAQRFHKLGLQEMTNRDRKFQEEIVSAMLSLLSCSSVLNRLLKTDYGRTSVKGLEKLILAHDNFRNQRLLLVQHFLEIKGSPRFNKLYDINLRKTSETFMPLSKKTRNWREEFRAEVCSGLDIEAKLAQKYNYETVNSREFVSYHGCVLQEMNLVELLVCICGIGISLMFSDSELAPREGPNLVRSRYLGVCEKLMSLTMVTENEEPTKDSLWIKNEKHGPEKHIRRLWLSHLLKATKETSRSFGKESTFLDNFDGGLVIGYMMSLYYWFDWRELTVWEKLCFLQNAPHRMIIVRNELQETSTCLWSSTGPSETGNSIIGHKLFVSSETITKWYKEDSWLFIWIILKGLVASLRQLNLVGVKFHLKHKWRSRLLQTLSGLEFCEDTVLLFTSSVKQLFPKNDKLLHHEAGLCYQSNPKFKGVHDFVTCPKMPTVDETQGKMLLILNEMLLDDSDNKVDLTVNKNWFFSKPMIKGVFQLQRPPELIDPYGNLNFINKALVQWKEHPPDRINGTLRRLHREASEVSTLRTRLFSNREYCYRIISLNRFNYLVQLIKWFSFLILV